MLLYADHVNDTTKDEGNQGSGNPRQGHWFSRGPDLYFDETY